MNKFNLRGISIPKFLFVFFTLVIGFSLNSQAQLLAGSTNAPAVVEEEVSADSIYATLLWDQFDPTIGPGVASQRILDMENSVVQSADDFEVPAGEIWSIEAVMTRGTFFNGQPDNGPIPSVDVIFYEDDSGKPGSVIGACNYPSSPIVDGTNPNISVSLPTPCELEEGHYWVSVMAAMPFTPNGQWAWSTVNFTTLDQWQFQDPDGIVGNQCVSWGDGFSDCGIGGSNALDLQFQLLGDIVNLFELEPITPAIKNNINSMTATGATPEGNVAFVWGFQTGTLIIGGHICGGTELGINPIQILGVITAEDDGTAEFFFYIPSLGGINVAYTQAVDIDTCNVSDVIENILQSN